MSPYIAYMDPMGFIIDIFNHKQLLNRLIFPLSIHVNQLSSFCRKQLFDQLKYDPPVLVAIPSLNVATSPPGYLCSYSNCRRCPETPRSSGERWTNFTSSLGPWGLGKHQRPGGVTRWCPTSDVNVGL